LISHYCSSHPSALDKLATVTKGTKKEKLQYDLIGGNKTRGFQDDTHQSSNNCELFPFASDLDTHSSNPHCFLSHLRSGINHENVCWFGIRNLKRQTQAFHQTDSKFEPLTFDPKPPRKPPDKSYPTRPIAYIIALLVLVVVMSIRRDPVSLLNQATSKLAFEESTQFEISNSYDLPEPSSPRARPYSSKQKLVLSPPSWLLLNVPIFDTSSQIFASKHLEVETTSDSLLSIMFPSFLQHGSKVSLDKD